MVPLVESAEICSDSVPATAVSGLTAGSVGNSLVMVIELWSEEAVRRWGVDALPEYRPPKESAGGPDAGSPDAGSPDAGGPDRSYPLQLLTPNTKNGIHSQFLHHPGIRALDSGPVLLLGLEDAGARGILGGERVRVFNGRGALTLTARLDLGLRQGCVVACNGYGREDGGSVNLLSMGRETDLGHGAAFHDNLVEVEKAP